MTKLPRRSSPQDATFARHALFFRIGDTRFALPAYQVAAVAEVASCTRIPSTDQALLGVARIGRGLLPLIDAHCRLDVVGRAPDAFPWTCVVVKGALGDVAFRVDEVLGLHALADGLLPAGCELMPFERLIDGGADVACGE